MDEPTARMVRETAKHGQPVEAKTGTRGKGLRARDFLKDRPIEAFKVSAHPVSQSVKVRQDMSCPPPPL